MIDKIFSFESTRRRHREAPMLAERERFLAHLRGQGVALRRLGSIAAMLLHVVRLLKLDETRMVEPSEIRGAGLQWTYDVHQVKGNRRKSQESFCSLATRWFQFAELISPAVTVKSEKDAIIEEFHQYLAVTRNLSSETVRNYRTRFGRFIDWISKRRSDISEVTLADVDDYLQHCRDTGFRPRTIASICCVLREFFRYAELRHFNTTKIASSITSPRVSKYDAKPRGPDWKDVRRLLDHGFGSSPAELRAAAILSLCSIYAMRSCEVVALTLKDLDWENETLTLLRAKSRKVQQFPLQFEVGETVLRYLRLARPKCACRSLFVTLKPPFRPVRACSTWHIVADRMKQLGISSETYGVHSLRHSCATQLLRKGSSLKEIAEFLGHTDMKSISIYAKYDSRTLTQVAAFSLTGVL